jgi:hypothetical protein
MKSLSRYLLFGRELVGSWIKPPGSCGSEGPDPPEATLDFRNVITVPPALVQC